MRRGDWDGDTCTVTITTPVVRGERIASLGANSETCGFFGMPVLFQYAIDDGPIELYDIWKEPIGKTLKLIEWFCEHNFIGFNCVFDWFQVAKCYTVFRLFPLDWIPEDHVEEIADREAEGMDGPCIKPLSACDLMLHSRKGPFQSLMERNDIRIKKVPAALAPALAKHLEETIEIDGIYFARNFDKSAPQWRVADIKSSKTGIINRDFKDVVLKFNPAGGLKFLAEYAMGKKPKHLFSDVELDTAYRPAELGYAPTAKAVASAPNWDAYDDDGKAIGFAWPAVIAKHIEHWATNEHAREYAYDDVVYTRDLWKHFKCPEPGDDDSVLACQVAVTRWRGFSIDREGIHKLKTEAEEVVAKAPININQPHAVRKYMMQTLCETELLLRDSKIDESTKKSILEEIREWYITADESCEKCGGTGTLDNGKKCKRCNGEGVLHSGIGAIGYQDCKQGSRAILETLEGGTFSCVF
jgi:hypothetical protein